MKGRVRITLMDGQEKVEELEGVDKTDIFEQAAEIAYQAGPQKGYLVYLDNSLLPAQMISYKIVQTKESPSD